MAPSKLIIASLLAGLMFAAPTAALAGSIEINQFSTEQDAGAITLDADLGFNFSADALEALRSGIALTVRMEFEITRRRKFLWDPAVVEIQQRYSIKRHALSERFVLTDLKKQQAEIYQSLDEALKNLGQVRDVNLSSKDALAADRTYLLRFKAKLEINSLPALLRPIAYVSPSWRMSTGWHEEILTP
ncbi:MAG: DUF4390 domain-containing protein [Pseudomonadota bacterium]